MKRLILILALAGVAGCTAVPPAPYVAADRATLTAVRGYLGVTVKDHPEMGPAVSDLLTTWECRVRAAEQAQGGIAPAGGVK